MRHSPNEIWSEILEELKDIAHQDVYLHQAVPLSVTAETLKIAVPSAYTRTRIEERFRADIQRVLATLIGAQCALTLIIDESASRRAHGDGAPHEIDSGDFPEQALGQNQTSVAPPTDPLPRNQTGLNSSYRFDTFVVDTPNRICHATALAVSENPGRDYNPLFIYGGSDWEKPTFCTQSAIDSQQHNPIRRSYTLPQKPL